MAASRALGMEPLVEVATEGEMTVALEAKARVIGVNNRNLHTMEVDMGRTRRLASMIPRGEGVEAPLVRGSIRGRVKARVMVRVTVTVTATATATVRVRLTPTLTLTRRRRCCSRSAE